MFLNVAWDECAIFPTTGRLQRRKWRPQNTLRVPACWTLAARKPQRDYVCHVMHHLRCQRFAPRRSIKREQPQDGAFLSPKAISRLFTQHLRHQSA